jgi:hypothetical protein
MRETREKRYSWFFMVAQSLIHSGAIYATYSSLGNGTYFVIL